jgi:signal transduction histidine kinase
MPQPTLDPSPAEPADPTKITTDTPGATEHLMTELRQQEALLATGALQSAIFNSANFSSIATDALGVIQIFNVGAARMLGYEAGDVINKITPADLSDPQELIERAKALSSELGIVIAPGFEALAFKASRGIEDIYELTYTCKDGSRLPAIVSVTALRDAQDSIIGYLLIGTDNTARKQLADELAQHRHHLEELVLSRTAELAHSRDAAQAASLAKSMFLANMSHEIRTPMNAILGLSYLALNTPLADETRHYIQKVHNAAENLLGIINGILDFSKAEAGKLQLENERFVLAEVLERVMETAGVEAKSKGLELALQVEALVPKALLGDAMRLGQVLLNLCANAIKFTEKGGVLVQVQSLLQLGTDVDLLFSVADTGAGIPGEQQVAIFEQFTQADASTTRSHGGTGLGLTISRQLVELMGGHLGVSSQVGVGATFHFNARFGAVSALPLETDHAERRPLGPSVETLAALHGAKVLLAEDNEVNQLVACAILRNAGLEIVVAGNGREALTLLNTHRDVDLVLMDCQMPVMDGFAATRAIRADKRFANLPVLAMTANVFPDDLVACRMAGMNGHIAKPFVIDNLFEVLVRWLKPVVAAIPQQDGLIDPPE